MTFTICCVKLALEFETGTLVTRLQLAPFSALGASLILKPCSSLSLVIQRFQTRPTVMTAAGSPRPAAPPFLPSKGPVLCEFQPSCVGNSLKRVRLTCYCHCEGRGRYLCPGGPPRLEWEFRAIFVVRKVPVRWDIGARNRRGCERCTFRYRDPGGRRRYWC